MLAATIHDYETIELRRSRGGQTTLVFTCLGEVIATIEGDYRKPGAAKTVAEAFMAAEQDDETFHRWFAKADALPDYRDPDFLEPEEYGKGVRRWSFNPVA